MFKMSLTDEPQFIPGTHYQISHWPAYRGSGVIIKWESWRGIETRMVSLPVDHDNLHLAWTDSGELVVSKS